MMLDTQTSLGIKSGEICIHPDDLQAKVGPSGKDGGCIDASTPVVMLCRFAVSRSGKLG